MPFITVGSASSSDLKPGVYEGTLVAINEKMVPSKFNNGEDAPSWEWVFTLSNGEEVNGLTSQFVTPKSRAFGYLVALLGKDKVVSGAGFELNDLVGKRALINVEISESGWPKVTAVLPPMAGVTPTAPEPVAVETPSPKQDNLPF